MLKIAAFEGLIAKNRVPYVPQISALTASLATKKNPSAHLSLARLFLVQEKMERIMVLLDKADIPLEDGAPNLTPDEIADSLGVLTGWDLVDGHHLHKAWTFQDFTSALDWVHHAGAICEKQGHHADFKLGWGYAEAITYTHKSEGLTRADIALATELDSIQGVDMS